MGYMEAWGKSETLAAPKAARWAVAQNLNVKLFAPCMDLAQGLGTLDLGSSSCPSSCSTGFGHIYDYWVLGP